MPKRYKEEFKKQAVAYYEDCHSLCMVAEKYQVAASTVNRWETGIIVISKRGVQKPQCNKYLILEF